jgi:hypothetical protein
MKAQNLEEKMRHTTIAIVAIVTLLSFPSSALSIRPAHATDFFGTTSVVIEGSWQFNIQVTDGNVPTGTGATGSVFFWGVTNEIDLSFDYFIIGTEYNRYGGFGNTPSNSFGGFDSVMQIQDMNPHNVYYVDGNPINHSPFGGGTLTVGAGGGSVSFNLETNGYDTGTPAPTPNPSSWAQFDWRHSFTKADQDSWNQKAGATGIKVPETNGIITDPIYAYAYLNYFVWNFWWGYTSGWYTVNWVYGGSNGSPTGSAGGCSFHLSDPTTGEPGGGTGTQTPSTNCPPAPPPPCGCGGGGSIAHGSLVTMADHSRVPVQNINVGDKLLGYDPNTGQFGVSTVISMKSVTTPNQLIIHTQAGAPFRVDANPRQTLWTRHAGDGTLLWLPVTQVQPGDNLYTPTGWVPVTSIDFAPAGQHTMFDITASMPYFADGYLDPIYKV